MSEVYLILYILSLIVLYKKHRRLTRALGPASLTLLFYIIFSLCSLYLYITKKEYYGELTLYPYIYLFLMVYLMLYSGLRYEKKNAIAIQCPSMSLLYLFFIVYAFCTLVILPHNIMHIKEGITTLFVSEYAGVELYEAAHESSNTVGLSGFFGLCTVIHNIFSEVAIFLMFYYFSLVRKKKWLIVLLLISFMSDIISPIASGLRTKCVMTCFSILLGFMFFKNYWSEKTYKIAKRVLCISLIFITIPFMALTISRFGRSDGGTSNSMISYVGQANLNFNKYGLDAGGIRYGDRTANIFKRMLGLSTTEDIMDTRYKYSKMKIDDGNFYTYVGDFTLDYGPIGGGIILILFSYLFIKTSKPKTYSIPFHRLLLVFISLCIALKGSMYLFVYAFIGNLVLIAVILMCVVLKIDYHNQRSHKYINPRINY